MGFFGWLFGDGGPPDWVPQNERGKRGIWVLVRTPGRRLRVMRPRKAWALVRKATRQGRFDDWVVREAYNADTGEHQSPPPEPDGIRELRLAVVDRSNRRLEAKNARRAKRQAAREEANREAEIEREIEASYRRGYLMARNPRRLSTAERAALPDSAFAAPGIRALPIHDAAHVHAAIGRFSQTVFPSKAEAVAAARRIVKAAKRHGVPVSEKSAVAQMAGLYVERVPERQNRDRR